MLAMVAAVTIVLAGGMTASASALPGPVRDLKVSFHKKYATFSWDAASGATRYVVVVEPRGVIGPFPATASTTSTSVRISYKHFPRYKTQKKGWEFIVEGYNKAGAGKVATSKAGVKLTVKGTKVKTSSAKAVAKKINSCLKAGETAALGAAAGAGIIALVTIWIPGANAVTAGGVLLAMAAAGGGTAVVCLVSD
jgi:hypothetical protein